MKLQSSISLKKNEALVGKKLRALVDEVEGGTAIARLSSQAPEIDGVVLLDTETRRIGEMETKIQREEKSPRRRATVALFQKKVRAGEFVKVQIVEAYDYDLKGVLIDDGRLCAPADPPEGGMSADLKAGIRNLKSRIKHLK